MKLRVLGAHNMESREHRMESHLIDDVLALDAGGLSRALTFQEQEGIGALILSHRHFDHVRDLLPLGLARRDSGRVVEVYAIEDTIRFVKDKLLDGSLYPDFLKSPTPENPTFRLNTIEFYREFSVLDYRVIAVPVPHAVPAAGFQISAAGGVRLFYTGDTGKGLSRAWDRVSPDVLLTEVTYGNENEVFRSADWTPHAGTSGRGVDGFQESTRLLAAGDCGPHESYMGGCGKTGNRGARWSTRHRNLDLACRYDPGAVFGGAWNLEGSLR